MPTLKPAWVSTYAEADFSCIDALAEGNHLCGNIAWTHLPRVDKRDLNSTMTKYLQLYERNGIEAIVPSALVLVVPLSDSKKMFESSEE